MKMIICTDSMCGIGKNGTIPWNHPEDMKYFAKQTKNGMVIMGRKTHETLPLKHLPNRTNIVLSRNWRALGNAKWQEKRVYHVGYNYFFNTKVRNNIDFPENTWVIGGAQVYETLLKFVDEIHWTQIEGDYDCDTHFNMSFLLTQAWECVNVHTLSDKAKVYIYKRK